MNNDDLKEEIKNQIKLSEIISKKVILKNIILQIWILVKLVNF